MFFSLFFQHQQSTDRPAIWASVCCQSWTSNITDWSVRPSRVQALIWTSNGGAAFTMVVDLDQQRVMNDKDGAYKKRVVQIWTMATYHNSSIARVSQSRRTLSTPFSVARGWPEPLLHCRSWSAPTLLVLKKAGGPNLDYGCRSGQQCRSPSNNLHTFWHRSWSTRTTSPLLLAVSSVFTRLDFDLEDPKFGLSHLNLQLAEWSRRQLGLESASLARPWLAGNTAIHGWCK